MLRELRALQERPRRRPAKSIVFFAHVHSVEGILGDDFCVHGRRFDYGQPVPRMTNARRLHLKPGEVVVVVTRRMECNVGAILACSRPSRDVALVTQVLIQPQVLVYPEATHRLPSNKDRTARGLQSTTRRRCCTPARRERVQFVEQVTVSHPTSEAVAGFTRVIALCLMDSRSNGSPSGERRDRVYKIRLGRRVLACNQVSVGSRVLVPVGGAPRQVQRVFPSHPLLEGDYHRIGRGKYKSRDGKVTQVYRKKWVTSRSLVSITRCPPAVSKHYDTKFTHEARINSCLFSLPPPSPPLPPTLARPPAQCRPRLRKFNMSRAPIQALRQRIDVRRAAP
ncbi:uncharacterized protein SCHCODRAFT_01155212 [Schizophyllum commune H4-8]|nr:uncharacterized protein SCHCODRAFT_01155212 [Schizophyllum commune H4-8]KAI5889991.1 hypothetical protein SCHCODRAFT_01155212 [Schizophyllum commune H4-8]